MEDGKPVDGSIFVYTPNKGAPVFFALAFAASAIGHILQCHHHKSWTLIGLHPLCAVMFSIGYVLREYGAFNFMYRSQDTGNENLGNLIVYVLSQVFIYICPPLLELANYHVLGRIFYYLPYFASLPAGRVLSTFGGLMVIVETLNALGVALSSNPASTHSTQQLGSHLAVAALVIQLCVILIFILLAIIFHRRFAKANVHIKGIRTLTITLYISMGLIWIRCIYRLVEHMGSTTVNLDDPQSLTKLSPILRYEWYFYIFEATLMLSNSVLWNIWNPGCYLPKNKYVYLAQDGSAELERKICRPGHPWLSILTFGLMFREKLEHRPDEELSDYWRGNHQV